MIVTKTEIPGIVAGRPLVGLTSGCFDLLHFFHLAYLERCAGECEFLIVGVDADALVSKNKGKLPIIPDVHRVAMVAGLKCVGAAFIMHSLVDFVEVYDHAHRIFRNAETTYGKATIGGEKLAIVPDLDVLNSTSAIIERIRERNRTSV